MGFDPTLGESARVVAHLLELVAERMFMVAELIPAKQSNSRATTELCFFLRNHRGEESLEKARHHYPVSAYLHRRLA